MTLSAPSLRLAFMGTPVFAKTALEAIYAAGHTIAAVYCQPPKPAGRGHNVHKTPVQETAEKLGLTVRFPKSLRSVEEQEKFAALNLDVAVVAAYGLILPKAVLDAPKHGCLNIHASLLPRWRGAAPIQRALLAGDAETGVTLMQMDEGLDTGAMLLKSVVPITDTTTAQSLHDVLADQGAALIVEALKTLADGKALPATPQPDEGVCYAAKLTREDGKIDWSQSAINLERQVRALTPWPGCFFFINGEPVKLHSAAVISQEGSPGTLLDDQFTVACGHKALRLLTVQRAGKKAIDAPSFLRGLRMPVGTTLL
ncbi:MAG: methionyl-tRNA formyltransferase [Alphaproteobacteria bacterium]|nr:methionyl-tRNA formyltransferase [Alphaproteobacteria bacterium]